MTHSGVQAEVVPVTIETILGPSRGRYFGSGFRKVQYSLLGEPKQGSNNFSCEATVTYPKDWSRDANGMVREPHLSTLDAVLLPLMVLDFLNLSEHARVSRLKLRAGSEAWEDLTHVPIEISQTPIESFPSQGTRYIGLVGNIRIEIDLDYSPEKTESTTLRRGLTLEERARSQVLSSTVLQGFNSESESIHCVHHFARTSDCDENSRTVSDISVVEHLAMMGQMAQALLALKHGASRSETLWMRNVTISLKEIQAITPASFTSTMTINRDRVIIQPSRKIRDFSVSAETSTGVEISALLAQEIKA